MSKLFALLLSSILLTISFPVAIYTPNLIPPALSSCAVWLAFVPMALVLRNATPFESFRWGYFFGFVANVGIFFWIIIAMQKYGGLPFFTSALILVSMALELALYPAVTFWMMARLRKVAPSWLVGTCTFVLVEWTRTYFPLEGFPWGTPAYALYDAFTLIQAGDIIGVAGFNFLILLGNFTLAESIVHRQQHRPLPKVPVTLFLLFFVVCWGYGYQRGQQITTLTTPSPTNTFRVALLQGNVLQDQKRDPAYRRKILRTYRNLTTTALSLKPDLIVWPEAALPMSIHRDTKRMSYLTPPNNDVDHVVGAPTRQKIDNRRRYFNSAFVLDPGGEVKVRYDKQHLVPFGEYVPLADVFPMHRIVPAVAGNFISGKEPKIATSRGTPYGILICYESLFPDLSVERVRKGAQFLVNITNDAWFDETSGPYQHLRFGRFRAIETRRPLVRSANTGVSAWFDSLGRIHGPTTLFSEDLVMADIVPSSQITFYVRHPQAAPLTAALLLLLCSLGFFQGRREKSS